MRNPILRLPAILIVLSALLFSCSCFAAAIAPSSVTFEDITGTGTRVLAGKDDAVVSANLGFSFHGLGSAVWISSNGLLGFGTPNNSPSNVSMLDAQGTLVAPLWSDWQFITPGADAVYYETEGEPGNQRFAVEWNKAGDKNFFSQHEVTFEAVLLENGNILFSYGNLDTEDPSAFGAPATVGAAGIPGTGGIQWSFEVGGVPSNSGLGISFTGNSLRVGPASKNFLEPSEAGSSLFASPVESAGSVAPEPGSFALLASGMGAILGLRRRKIISM